jgi:uncharacterized protein
MSLKFIVIDTNIFISAALSPNGTAYQAFSLAIQEFTIVQSAETYQEIAQRIYKPKFDKYVSDERREELLNLIKHKSQFFEPTSKVNYCRDPDDNKFLDLLIDSNAKFLITGDKDLLTLNSQPECPHPIISARDFLELY